MNYRFFTIDSLVDVHVRISSSARDLVNPVPLINTPSCIRNLFVGSVVKTRTLFFQLASMCKLPRDRFVGATLCPSLSHTFAYMKRLTFVRSVLCRFGLSLLEGNIWPSGTSSLMRAPKAIFRENRDGTSTHGEGRDRPVISSGVFW